MLNLDQYLQDRDQHKTAEQLLPLADIWIASLVRRGCIPRGVDRDDLLQEARLAVVNAVRKYRPDCGRGLRSFVLLVIHRDVLRYIRRWNREIPERVPQNSLSDGFSGMLQLMAEAEDGESRLDFDNILGMLPAGCPRIKQVLSLAFRDGLSEGEIATRIGRGQAVTHKLLARGIQRLRRVCDANTK